MTELLGKTGTDDWDSKENFVSFISSPFFPLDSPISPKNISIVTTPQTIFFLMWSLEELESEVFEIISNSRVG